MNPITDDDPVVRVPGRPFPPRSRVLSARLDELRRLHPGKYLAFREVWDGDELREPFVVAIGDSATAVEAAVLTLPAADRDGVVIRKLFEPRACFTPFLFPRKLG